jgi:3-isopropylmalate/(R)-2-methylmalate dehydratase large subunit
MDQTCFFDRHFIHEVTSPVFFFRSRKRHLGFIPRAYFATADHNTPTINQHLPVEDPYQQINLKHWKKMLKNTASATGGGNAKNGIVHVIGPENGITCLVQL